MYSRAYLARVKAKFGKVNVKAEKKIVDKFICKDPKTGIIVKTYDDIYQAINDGNSLPNIMNSIKNHTKYKGFLWSKE